MSLFGGSLKVLPDGLRRRGDINVLLFGDPGVAKSQLLKFAVKVSPIGVYASGKGSSAAGLTASINRDPHSGNFIVEGGAMVLADGGCVAIDEFDKMRSEDRVAIHEAMEQQTISIAKAGITTTLNSRCAVLAAANSVYGRWDESRGQENIDLMPTILSRFDMIFLVKDTHDPHRDATLAKHVMDIHCKSSDGSAQDIDNLDANQLSMSTLRGYIAYCRKNFGPRLTKEAAAKLNARFVSMRQEVMGRKTDEKGGAIKTKAETSGIPITIRQLEAIIRIAESLAKMEMLPYATEEHVDEALRLFSISTMSTALSGSLVGVDEMTRPEDFDAMQHIEKQIKHRFVVGTRVSEHQVVQDFMRQKFTAPQVKRVLAIMQRRGEIQYRLQRQVLYRIK